MKKRSINIFGSTSDSSASKQSRNKKKSEAERETRRKVRQNASVLPTKKLWVKLP
jgi:hypothetical protein